MHGKSQDWDPTKEDYYLPIAAEESSDVYSVNSEPFLYHTNLLYRFSFPIKL